MRSLILSFFFFGLIALTACEKDEEPEPEPPVIDPCEDVSTAFAEDIQPIFANSCANSGCHDHFSAEGGKIFDTYENIVASIEDDQEQFLMSINFEGGSTGWMPRDLPEQNANEENQLPASKIEMIECWIESGMPNN